MDRAIRIDLSLPPLRRSPPSHSALIAGISTWLITVNMPTIPSVERRGQERKLLRNAVSGHVKDTALTIIAEAVVCEKPLCTNVEVHTIAKVRHGSKKSTSRNADHNVGDIIIGAPAVRKPCGISGQPAKTLLTCGPGRINAKVHAQQLGARIGVRAVGWVLTWILQESGNQVCTS